METIITERFIPTVCVSIGKLRRQKKKFPKGMLDIVERIRFVLKKSNKISMDDVLRIEEMFEGPDLAFSIWIQTVSNNVAENIKSALGEYFRGRESEEPIEICEAAPLGPPPISDS